MASIPHVLRSWHEWRIERGDYKGVLMVETDLETSPDRPGFDKHALNELMNALIGEMENHPLSYDSVTVSQRGARSA